jgi:putative phosphoesterase
MRVAVISDVHDNIWALNRVLQSACQDQPDVFLVCGDLCAPFTLAAIMEGFAGPIHVVLGNNDGDALLLARTAAKRSNVALYNVLAELELEGRKVAVTHYPEIGRRLARCGEFEAVFFGHSHQAELAQEGRCLAVNPGEVMGRFGRCTYAIYDTASASVEIKEA